MEIFNLKKLNYVHVISNRSGASKKLCGSDDVNVAWERERIKISLKERVTLYKLKQHYRWFYEGCSELSVERKQAKLEWLQDLGKINADNPKNVRSKTTDSRHFWDKKMEHVKSKIKLYEAYIQTRNIY